MAETPHPLEPLPAREPCAMCGNEEMEVVPGAEWSLGKWDAYCKRCDLYQGWEIDSPDDVERFAR